MINNEHIALLALQAAHGIGPYVARKLINHFGSAIAVFNCSQHDFLSIHGVGLKTWKSLHNTLIVERAQKEYYFLNKKNINYCGLNDVDYPSHLFQCPDAPLMLFYRGNPFPKNKPILSIVGSREANKYGIDFTKKLIKELTPYEPIVVSGLAYGIDIAAHKSAIDCGLATYACLAHGIEDCYPEKHRKYLNEMIPKGGYFTEFWNTSKVLKSNFLTRNRIIAGISQASIVIQSRVKGGAMVTARLAQEYHREVFAVPGAPNNPLHQGCHSLIKKHIAHLITSSKDIIYQMGWEQIKTIKIIQKELFNSLTNDQKLIVNCIENNIHHIDAIAIKTSLAVSKVFSELFELEMKGVVRPKPGKAFELV